MSAPSEDSSGTDTAALARRAGAGDVDGFNELYRSVAPALYAWANLHVVPALRRRLDPDDLVQEVSYRALRSISTYGPARASFRTWLFAIANNVLREAARAIARLPAGSARLDSGLLERIPSRTTAITTRVARDEGVQRFLERLRALPDDDRSLLIYRGLEGLRFEEIGELMGESAQTLAKRWQRLRDRIQSQRAPFQLFDED